MAENDADMNDLFGSDSDNDQQAEEQGGTQQSGGGGPASLEDEDADDPGAPASTKGLFGSEEESEEEERLMPASRRPASSGSEDEEGPSRAYSRQQKNTGEPMHIEGALLPVPPHGSVCLLRTSNIVGIQPKVFDPVTHEREEESFIDDRGIQRVKLASNAVIRWRVRRLPDGREVRESNARFVRWEDGSMQLLLGDEVLDIAQQDMKTSNTYLLCAHGSSCVQGLGHLTTKLALRPSSLDSGLHRRLREVVDKRHSKVYKVASHGGLQNPELDKARREAAEEERIREREALARKQDRVMARAYGGGQPRRGSRYSDRYMDEEQELDEGGGGGYDYDDGLTADQRARLSLSRNRTLMDDGPEAEASRRLQSAKRGRAAGPSGAAGKRRRAAASDEEEEEEEDEELEADDDEEEEPEYESSGDDDGGDDDDDEDEGRKKAKIDKSGVPHTKAPPPPPINQTSKARQRRGVVLSDDEDE